ncbi:MAG: helix-turn-helix transcriptional regulator [Gammaproteobacteria bacterium]|nr:helix-turn-helix transcriptional regulator [Gammaproteobacteria bacterium]
MRISTKNKNSRLSAKSPAKKHRRLSAVKSAKRAKGRPISNKNDKGRGVKNPLRQLLAARFRSLREARGWSQEELSEASRLHRTYISLIERSQCNVSLDNLARFAGAFGLTITELFTFDEKTAGRSTSALSKRKTKGKGKR